MCCVCSSTMTEVTSTNINTLYKNNFPLKLFSMHVAKNQVSSII